MYISSTQDQVVEIHVCTLSVYSTHVYTHLHTHKCRYIRKCIYIYTGCQLHSIILILSFRSFDCVEHCTYAAGSGIYGVVL